MRKRWLVVLSVLAIAVLMGSPTTGEECGRWDGNCCKCTSGTCTPATGIFDLAYDVCNETTLCISLPNGNMTCIPWCETDNQCLWA